MSDRRKGILDGPHQHAHGAVPTPQQIRTVGQRRREAEEKLEHHLDEASHKDDHHTTDPETETTGKEEVDSGDIAAIQNDDRLTAADRVDLIANQAIPEEADKNTQPPHGTP